MPTSAEAIAELEAAKKTLEGQRAAGGSSSSTNLLIAIQRIADEITALAEGAQKEGTQKPDTQAGGAYAPRTDAFKSATLAAASFAAELESVAAEFAGVAAVAPALDRIRRYLL